VRQVVYVQDFFHVILKLILRKRIFGFISPGKGIELKDCEC
jgi:hypothetical protein